MTASFWQAVNVFSSSRAEDRDSANDVEMEQGPEATTTALAPPAHPKPFRIVNSKFHRRLVVLPRRRFRSPTVTCLGDDEIEEFLWSCPDLKFESEFVTEPVRRPGLGDGYVALRARNTEFYITAQPYGDAARNFYADLFEGEKCPRHLRELVCSDVVSYVVDFLVLPSLDWQERPGFGCVPISAVVGPPGLDQLFRVEERDHRGVRSDESGDSDEHGLRTYFGAYLRSGPLFVVSQGPLCQDGDRWELLSDDAMDEQ